MIERLIEAEMLDEAQRRLGRADRRLDRTPPSSTQEALGRARAAAASPSLPGELRRPPPGHVLQACPPLVLAVVALAYLPVLAAGFVWDDALLVVENTLTGSLLNCPGSLPWTCGRRPDPGGRGVWLLPPWSSSASPSTGRSWVSGRRGTTSTASRRLGAAPAGALARRLGASPLAACAMALLGVHPRVSRPWPGSPRAMT